MNRIWFPDFWGNFFGALENLIKDFGNSREGSNFRESKKQLSLRTRFVVKDLAVKLIDCPP